MIQASPDCMAAVFAEVGRIFAKQAAEGGFRGALWSNWLELLPVQPDGTRRWP